MFILSNSALRSAPSPKALTSVLPYLLKQLASLLGTLHSVGWYPPTQQSIHGFSFASHPGQGE
jgi:hypothetical protein